MNNGVILGLGDNRKVRSIEEIEDKFLRSFEEYRGGNKRDIFWYC